jgi:hypothetical protein
MQQLLPIVKVSAMSASSLRRLSWATDWSAAVADIDHQQAELQLPAASSPSAQLEA